MRVTFINPPSGLDRDFYEIPLNIAYLTACVRARGLPVECTVIDMELASADGPWALLDAVGPASAPDVIAAPLYTYSMRSCLQAVELMKRWHPEAVAIVGGPHATLAPREMIANPAIDIVAVGEGDDSFVEILEQLLRGRDRFFERLDAIGGLTYKLDGQVVEKPRRPLIRDLDRVPLATGGYDIFDLEEVRKRPNFVPVMTSRGCPYQCIFCSSADLWEHRINFRSPANVRRELEEIRDYGFRVVNFRDDMFTIRKRTTIEIARILGELGFVWGCETRADCVNEELLRIMVDNGLCTIRFGIESFHQKSLDLLNKRERVEDLITAIELCGTVGVPEVRNSFMIGIPGETEEDVLTTLRIARSYPFTTNRFWAFTPVIGTEAHERMDSLGIQWVQHPDERKATHSIVRTLELTNDQINRLVEMAHQEFGHPLTRVHRDLQAAPRLLAERDARRPAVGSLERAAEGARTAPPVSIGG